MNRQVNYRNNQYNPAIIMTICLVSAVVVTYGSFISLAKGNNKDNGVHKYYTSIQIQSGDTLWELANDYITTEYASINDYIKEIKYLNALDSDQIHEGQYLTMPYYSNTLLDK